MYGIESDLRHQRLLVRIVDPGESANLAAASLGVHPLHVAAFADIKRRINEDFDEAITADHLPHTIARLAIWTDRGADHRSAVAHDLRGHEANAKNVRVAVFLREA